MYTTLLLWLGCLSVNIQSREFSPYSYDEIVSKFAKWQTEHPNIFHLSTARHKYNLFLPANATCGEHFPKCEHHIVIITNHGTWNNDLSRPHVFLSGALHGNEQVGPTTLVELIDYLLFEYKNNAKNAWIQYLINNRVIILTPMTNSIGYAQSQREEQGIHSRIDPNRDFPYHLRQSSECMKSIAARVINEIFREYLIQLAITFHGGMRAISYEWGAPNHATPKDYSPDHIAQLQLVSNMQILGGHLNHKGGFYYPIGTLNKVVYAVSGGMEDWAYGGSWDKSNVIECEPNTYDPYPKEKTVYNDAMLRAFNFLIEASDVKIPRNKWGHIKNDWNDIWRTDHDEYDGHVPRNIRISMFVINSAMPYVMIRKYPRVIPWNAVTNRFLDGTAHPKYKQNVKVMNWFVSGAMSLYEYDVLYAMKDADHTEFEWNVLEFEKNAMWRANLDLNSQQNMISKVFKFSIDVETKLTVELMKQMVSKCNAKDNLVKTDEGKVYCPIWLSVRVKVDDQWRDNRDLSNWKVVKTYPEDVPPQSHVVNARNKERNEWNMTNNKYYVQANEWWYAVKPIRTDIYYVYDDQDDIQTEYADQRHDDGSAEAGGANKSHRSILYVALVVLCLCIVVCCGRAVMNKLGLQGRNRRRIGTKTYQRVSQISIV
eukprot:6425_1